MTLVRKAVRVRLESAILYLQSVPLNLDEESFTQRESSDTFIPTLIQRFDMDIIPLKMVTTENNYAKIIMQTIGWVVSAIRA